MIINTIQELETIAKLKPKIEKAQERQKEIEKKGQYYILEDFAPKTAVFVPKGKNVKKYLENHKNKLENRNNKIKKLKL